ncbi:MULTISPECIES: flagellar basal body-associated FliL family protein [Alkalimonas]|uniref:Flagellar protein FliL n=1 Tax=Alkalimonas mucilaginosa TaxID=3057676 RepID=A0ABU7JEC9_9GAMM|nr:flagellar basal body-associated FliL family protein [Alkalimonas sp. MEB004]MEE2024046.1 flagellar basal body-associated FliL family protein [Alkalimonas sp. MEB004]
MKTLILIVAAVCLIAVGVGGSYWYSQQNPQVAEPTRPLFFPLERFVISVDSQHHSRYLVLELTLVSHDPVVLAMLQDAVPLLRNALVQHFSNSQHLDVKNDFKDIPQVQAQLLHEFNQALRLHKFSHQIEQVLVTNVFIQ